MTAPKVIKELVERFEANLSAYKSKDYNEAQLRQEFLDEFFEALGWDVRNRIFKAGPKHKEVIIEKDEKPASGKRGVPDYTFTYAGQKAIFIVEAKRPSVNIKKDKHAAYQLREYAWNSELPLSILTNFEEFAIYDTRKKPHNTDAAYIGRKKCYNYKDYIDKWDEIYGIFSKDAVMKDDFDRYAEKDKKGTERVGEEFLKVIEGWREELAKNIAQRNSDLTVKELNYAVQRTIDRIIFLRMCEDMGAERYGQLLKAAEKEDIYASLIKLYKKADAKYNSGLFHFKKEKGRATEKDTITPKIKIDDKVLNKIISVLYDGPYNFSVMGPEILGNVYEQFLGKIIRLTASHGAMVEEKPEVKKAGGVYYTPQYIVEYIVENTVGKLVKGKTPKQLEKLRILDPACGSGSFLLGAYTYLLKYHLDYYTRDNNKYSKTKKHKNKLIRINKNWELNLEEKKRILLNNIYGVDIDEQAVEVTKLSLLLKLLEGNVQKNLNEGERILPDLGNNIKCGNSLIGPDFYASGVHTTLSDDEMDRINVFDWEKEFPDIMERGGFDAVIGNPPYARIQTLKEYTPLQAEELKKKYASAQSGNFDIYVVFIEKGLELINSDGVLGYITPHKFFNSKYGKPIRKLISEGRYLSKIVHFGDIQIFKGATTYTSLIFLDKKKKYKFELEKVTELSKWKRKGTATTGKISLKEVTENEWNFVVGPGADLFKRLQKMPVKLDDVAERIFQGPITSADDVFLFKKYIEKQESQQSVKVWSNELEEWVDIEKAILKAVVRSGHINRYTAIPTAFVLYPYDVSHEKARLFTQNEMQSRFPLAWNYLKRNMKQLENREKGKFKDANWYRFGRTQNLGM